MINYYLNGNQITPKDREEINYILDFEDDKRLVDIDISVSALTLVGADRELVINWLTQFGKGAGMPATIDFGNVQQRYYIDFNDGFELTNNTVTVTLKRRNATNNFFDSADALVFRAVNWSSSDFKDIDYVIVPEIQAIYVITLLGTTFSLAQELAQSTKDIAEGISDVTEASVPSQTVVGVPVVNWGLIISASIKLAARIAYAIFIVIQLVNVIKEIINLIVPKIRQFKGITYKRLIEKGVAHLGYNLQSSFLNEIAQLTYLPTPIRRLDSTLLQEIVNPLSLAMTEGFPTENDSIPTLGRALNELCEIYNLRITAVENNVIIEREDFFNQTQTSPIPLAYNLQEDHDRSRTFNDENFSRQIFVWRTDPQDVLTFDDNKGQIAEIGANLLVDPNTDIRLIKGLDQPSVNFSLGSRKNELNFAEKSLKSLAKAVDFFTGGGLASKVSNRVGVLQISNQYFSNNKLLWMSGNRIAPDHREKLGAINILKEYHRPFEVKLVGDEIPVRMTKEEFLLYSEQNFVILNSGERAEILSLQWNEADNLATLKLEFETDFNTNFQFNELNRGGL